MLIFGKVRGVENLSVYSQLHIEFYQIALLAGILKLKHAKRTGVSFVEGPPISDAKCPLEFKAVQFIAATVKS